MQHNLISVTKCHGTLRVQKSSSGYFAELYIGDTKIRTADASAFENIHLSDFEGQQLPVMIQGKQIFFNQALIAEFDNLFNDVLAGLMISTDKTYATVSVKRADGKREVVSEKIPLSELPAHLFDRRTCFPVRIYDDNNWMIIRYANLHQHTDSSLLDGITKVPDLVKKTEWAAAVTDHGNMYAFHEFYAAMKKAGKLPIIGCEVYIETPGGQPRPVLSVPSDTEDSDARMFDNERKPSSTLAGEHMILLAKNETGLHNLFQLVTHASEHFYRKPHVTWDLLEKYHEGLIATSACMAGTLGESIKQILKCRKYKNTTDPVENQAVSTANARIANKYIREMIRLFGKDDFYLELQNHHFHLEKEIMDGVRAYARKNGLKTTIGIDAHYLNKEDASVHEMWLCQQTKTKMSDPKHMKFSGDGYYVHNSDEVVELFPDDAEALDNTLEIAEKCRLDLKDDGYHLPSFPLPDGFSSSKEYLESLVYTNFKTMWDNGVLGADNHSETTNQIYRQRLRTELDTIEKMGWETYFLVVMDFIRYAEDSHVAQHVEEYFPQKYFDTTKIPEKLLKTYPIYIGSGRGSAAGSLVCCCLGITKVDPIKYDLLFERFLSPDRISMPDIDTDLEDSGREQVIEYCRYKYGYDCVSRIITFVTSAAKNILRTIVRVNDLPVALGNELASAVPKAPKITLKQAEEQSPDFKALEANQKNKELIEYAKKLEGLKQSQSVHACGVLMAPQPVVNYMPMVLVKNPQGKEKVWCTQLQGPECEDMGLLKMDFLGLITLGEAHEAINLIKQNHGVTIDYDKIPLDDLSVYQYLAKGHTEAVFQAESEIFTKTITGVLKDIDAQISKANAVPDAEVRKRVRHQIGEKMFLRVSDCNALVRPGPNQYTERYTKAILGKTKIEYDDPSMEEYLADTGGIMLYQEQVMLLCRKMAGFSAGQADTIRKAMGKKKRVLLDEYRSYFISGSVEKHIKGCVNNGIPEEVAKKVWNDMEQFAKYAFNKSHAVAYSMHTVRTAWLSKNYFPEWMTAVLNANIGKPDKIRGYLAVVKERGIRLLPPDINKSNADFSTDGVSIRFGLNGLKSVGAVADALLNERIANGEFLNYTDFLTRMAKCSKINKTALSSLIYAGCLDSFDNSSRNAKIQGIASAVKWISKERRPKKKARQISLEIPDLEYDRDLPEMPKKDLLRHEEDVAGYYMSGHPLDEFGQELSGDKNIRKISVLRNAFDDDDTPEEEKEDLVLKDVRIAGIIKAAEKKYTKKNKIWWSLTVEDETGIMKCTYFQKDSDKQEIMNALFAKHALVSLQGDVSDSGYGAEMRVRSFASLSKFMNDTQAPYITLVYAKHDAVRFHGSYKTIRHHIQDILDKHGKQNSHKGAAMITAIAIDNYANGTEEDEELGYYKLNLEQYVDLQYLLGMANVTPWWGGEPADPIADSIAKQFN